uniref:FAD-binding PCMH-type domain-containing protein n=1 Tax=Setaria italica TaxID=4555 RepID=A0A341JWU0_SETIT
MAIRVHSGGHSYEGQSYTVDGAVLEDGAPFVVIDLMSLNRVRVDAASATTWVECGATLSKVYYAGAASSVSSSSMVNGSSSSLAFTAGLCSTVSVGGHISGSGFGLLLRKFMLTVDNVLLPPLPGQLIPVPGTVMVFTLKREGSVDAIARLVHWWPSVGPALPDEFYLSIFLMMGGSLQEDDNVT